MSWKERWLERTEYAARYRQHIVVLLILLIAVGFVIYLYLGTSELANRTVCAGHLSELATALLMYSQDYDGQYPASDDRWSSALLPYVKSLASFICPSDDSIRPRRGKHREVPISYWYRTPVVGVEDVAVSGDRMYSNFLSDHEGGGNVVYPDGHTRWTTYAQWKEQDLPTQLVFTAGNKRK